MNLRAVFAMLVAMTASARADDDEPAPNFPDPTGPDYTITSPGERTTKNEIILASIAGGGALFGLIGGYYHRDSHSASNKVTAIFPTNHPWSATDQASYDQAESSRTKAIVFYSIGGAALVTAAVYLIVTQPADTQTLIHPHRRFVPKVDVAPTGAVLGGGWTF
ncbi:MAG TPA: hypothetical protein VGO00_13220 [Kofleriaceae bacterium]|nr:hypothetical protein [Kofleriaceae bacterium]